MFMRALVAIVSGAGFLLLTRPVGSSFISGLDAPTAAFLFAADTVAAYRPVSLATGAR